MIDYKVLDFDIKKLGSFYDKEKTIFRVFAPSSEKVFLVINNHKYEMHKSNCTFEIGLKGNLECIKYHYENELGVKYRDPFAYFSDDNDSYVLDTNKFNKETVVLNRIKDSFIYEVSVRDFSSAESFNGDPKKKFLSLTKDNLKINDYFMIGLDYLKNLGYTHIQLMPIFDFDNDNSEYNWGYNPTCYNYVKKDYVLDENNPYAYVNELRSAVNKMHENGLRVTLDVVFNHVYKAVNFDLEKMMPGSIFRYKDDGSLAAGTFCGNEIKSEDEFVRAYLIEMIERYIMLFDIDGVRLDLMGILDYETVNKIAELKKYKSDFIVYGEGWNMGDVLSEDLRASSLNAEKMDDVGFFNDFFRDTIINYCCGNSGIKEDVKKALTGNNNNLKYYQSVNYVECHDNLTFYDRIQKAFPDEEEQKKINRCKLALALCIVARGIPFIHSGQEFLRTKNLVENSYNSSDEINKLDWDRRVKFNDVCDYVKQLIEFRKNSDLFTGFDTNIYFNDYYECLVYHLNDLLIVINNCDYNHIYNDGNEYEVLFDVNGRCSYPRNNVDVPACSLVILKKLYN